MNFNAIKSKNLVALMVCVRRGVRVGVDGSRKSRLYYEEADVVKCAATYGYHLSQAHAFIDGNKRVAAATMLVFLDCNGFEVEASADELINVFLQLASSEMNARSTRRVSASAHRNALSSHVQAFQPDAR